MENEKLVSLSTVKVGQKVKLANVDSGRGMRSRLAAMGLVPGVEITVVNNTYPGPFMLKVKGSKIMLGRGMAHKILVTQD
ncbi:MAG: ferrous iron transport protein A [Planctomycetes bacterium]|nr:ferrous iron transport protein A [Planctomycetota bacterium]MCK5473067.1 ferrous iron transport protein A [Planctomycetota bacterium]